MCHVSYHEIYYALNHIKTGNHAPLWYQSAAPVLSIGATIFGGYVRSRRNLKTNRVLDAPTTPIPPIPEV